MLCVFLLSCSKGETYYRFHHTDNGKWHRDSVFVFPLDSFSVLPGSHYEVTVELTTNRGYPYRDLWLRIDEVLRDSTVRIDTLRCLLADEHGRWLGNGVGGLNQLSLPYRTFVPRDSGYLHSFKLRHCMGDTELKGVEKVGIRIIDKGLLNQ